MGDDFSAVAAGRGYEVGWDDGGYEDSIDCNAALGLIGLLGLIELLRHTLVDVNDGYEDPSCMERGLCEANRQLVETSSNNGGFLDEATNGFLASLLTQVAAKSFTGYNSKRYRRALKAGEAGRGGANCLLAYPRCALLKARHRPFGSVNSTEYLLRRMGGTIAV
ncbi:uncharacterized protein LOC135198338 [Macrobrachium nipponense]|uniref:uncharacterized protein LOC135198338 n=1 Tax=Macrobrachium nipponense TaxID=159736 RepID=UPI0030C8777C